MPKSKKKQTGKGKILDVFTSLINSLKPKSKAERIQDRHVRAINATVSGQGKTKKRK